MDLAVEGFVGDVGLQVLEGFFLLLLQEEVTLCSVEVGLQYFFLFLALLCFLLLLQFLTQTDDVAEVDEGLLDFAKTSMDQSSQVEMLNHVVV